MRLCDEAVVPARDKENPLTPADREAGVLGDAWVILDRHKRHRTSRLRVLTVRKPSGTPMRLVTNLPPEQLSAAAMLALYRRRWQIECFFRWIKCLLGCRHWLAGSAAGVTVQL